jgi:hypothetical protein
MTIKQMVEKWSQEALAGTIDKSRLSKEEIEIYECCGIVFNDVQNGIINAYNTMLKAFYVAHGRNITPDEFSDKITKDSFQFADLFILINKGLHEEFQQKLMDYLVSDYKRLLLLEEGEE